MNINFKYIFYRLVLFFKVSTLKVKKQGSHGREKGWEYFASIHDLEKVRNFDIFIKGQGTMYSLIISRKISYIGQIKVICTYIQRISIKINTIIYLTPYRNLQSLFKAS